MHILGVTQRPVEAPSSPFGGARSPDSVPIPIFQTVSEGVFPETAQPQSYWPRSHRTAPPPIGPATGAIHRASESGRSRKVVSGIGGSKNPIA